MFEQSFEVTSLRTKAEWHQVCRERLFHMHYGFANHVDFDAMNISAGFLPNRLYPLSVYSFYSDAFFDNTTAHIWTGLAKHAGGAVYGGLSDSFDGDLGTDKRKFQMGLLTGLDGIFRDLGWQFQAYSCGGLASLEHAFSRSEIRIELRDAWQDLQKGHLINSPDLLDRGGLAQARFEQEVILVPAFNILRPLSINGVPVPTLLSLLAKNPVPGGGDFDAVVGNSPDMTEFEDRWTWITTPTIGMWWLWKGLGMFGRWQATAVEFEDICQRHLRFPPLR